MATGQKAGLHGMCLTQCVIDIVLGHVQIENVIQIHTLTKCEDLEAFERLISKYAEAQWKGLTRAKEVALQLWLEDKIYQPILNGHTPHFVGPQHWIKLEGRTARPVFL